MAISPEDRPFRDDGEPPPFVEARLHPSIDEILTDPATSRWLKVALETALTCDPVDALNDALLLAVVLEARLRADLGIDADRP